MTAPRLAFVTIGQAPREDMVPEILHLLDAAPGAIRWEEFGALDGLDGAGIAALAPGPREARLHTRLAAGGFAVVASRGVESRLTPLMTALDGMGFDLIVLASTSVFQPFRLRTPLVHAQREVDAWIGALVMGEGRLGLIHALPGQHRGALHGTLTQSARAVMAGGESAGLEAAAERLRDADLILMHSVSYTEAEAARLAALARRPVVTARRIIVGAIRLHLARLTGTPPLAPEAAPVTEGGLIEELAERFPADTGTMTPRERDVLAAVLEGHGNKAIGRRLGISHRTVEIHRGRAMAKLHAGSPTELIRRLLIARAS